MKTLKVSILNLTCVTIHREKTLMAIIPCLGWTQLKIEYRLEETTPLKQVSDRIEKHLHRSLGKI